MTNPYLDLYFCIINIICGMFFFTIYSGILIIEKNKKNYIIYLIDFFSVLTIGLIYLLVLNTNRISFHIYFILFIILGYYTAYKLFNKQIKESYRIFFIILRYLYEKFKIIVHWCFDIILIKILVKILRNKIIKRRVKNAIKKFNKQIIKEDE